MRDVGGNLLLCVGVGTGVGAKDEKIERIRTVVGDRILMSNCTAVVGKEGVDVKVNRSGGPGRP